jgi:hypothetical protein
MKVPPSPASTTSTTSRRPLPSSVSARALMIAAALAVPTLSAHAELKVVSTSPVINETNVPRSAPISITFDQAVDPSTFTAQNLWAFARWTGPLRIGSGASLSFSNANKTITLTPDVPLLAGESVMVILSNKLKAADGTTLRAGGYAFTFTAAASPSAGEFCHRTTFTSEDASGNFTRIYGGLACDLNLDGAPDLTLVNEVSADLRVFLNLNDGSGLFGPLLEPPAKIPYESSPNEPADFNADGFIDVITSSYDESALAIVLGQGDGTFQPGTSVNVGFFPRGNAILDVDGDGDQDIAVCVTAADEIVFIINNGNGTFAPPASLSTTDSGPYGLTTADMNADGLMDLVVGFSYSQTCASYLNNGNGTFTKQPSQSIGGNNWVIATGDVNNDGHIDVGSANAGSANVAMLLGNGNGTLKPPTTYGVGGHCPGNDLADFDGDGDLDWIVSIYGAGDWKLFENDGTGAFTLKTVWPAAGQPGCAVPADFDGDGRVDLCLLDETGDEVQVWGNSALGACYANCDCSAVLDINDFICFQTNFAIAEPAADCDESGTLSIDDFICFQTLYALGC